MRSDTAPRSSIWLTILVAAGLLAGGIARADAADLAGPDGYAPRPHHHHRFHGEVAMYAPGSTVVFDDSTAEAAEVLALQPAPPSPDVVARRELALPVGVIYNVPADPFLARRRYGPVIRANY